jgi:hypothetical protein
METRILILNFKSPQIYSFSLANPQEAQNKAYASKCCITLTHEISVSLQFYIKILAMATTAILFNSMITLFMSIFKILLKTSTNHLTKVTFNGYLLLQVSYM